MDSTSTGAQLAPTPDAYTLPEWLKIYNNGARVPSDHPRYQEVRGLMHQALQQITMMHHQQHIADVQDADLHPYAPGAGTSFAAGTAQGMSLGLGGALSDDFSQELGRARADHPVAAGAGNLVGGAIPATIGAGLPAFAGAPLVPGALAAGMQGTLESGPGTGVLAAGATLIGGKILGKAASMVGLDKVAGRALGALAAKFTSQEGEQMVSGIPVSQLRARLAAMGVAPGDVENAVQAALKAHVQEAALGGRAAADASGTRPQVKGTMGPLAKPAPDPLDQPAFMRNAQEATPAATHNDVLDALGGRGGVPATPASKLARDLLDLQSTLGRALTPAEKEQVLAQKLASLGKGETLPYSPRGGAAEQKLPPLPSSSAPAAPSKFDATATAQALQQELALAKSLGLPPTQDMLNKRIANLTPVQVKAVMKALGGLQKGASAPTPP